MQRLENQTSPWGRWELTRKLTHYRPMLHNTVYLPNVAINAKECLDHNSILVKIIGVTRKEESVADFVKKVWRPKGTYKLTRVNRQSF